MTINLSYTDAFREGPVYENTFRGNANGRQKIAESFGRLWQ